MSSLTPGQHVIKIVNEELTSLMGDVSSKIMISPKPPTIIMMDLVFKGQVKLLHQVSLEVTLKTR